jgi:very-short-patch-repair endonuclease
MDKTTLFIEKAKIIHFDKYDYNKVDYINAKNKIIIICKIHGEFNQTPDVHISGGGCLLCGREKSIINRTGNLQCFIEKANKVHNFKYDYSKSIYKNAIEKITIICKIHGEFEQKPNGHLCGKGCNLCGKISTVNKRSKDKDEFIKDALKIHGNTYDYSKVDYINAKNKVIIICKKHGEILQTPNVHLNGGGCTLCGIEKNTEGRKFTNKVFIEKANNIHNNNYDYSKTNYVISYKKVIIICKKHGEFFQVATSHLKGIGCNKCAIEKNAERKKSNSEEFIEKSKKINGDNYDYSNVVYKGTKNYIDIICKKHGLFKQTPSNHLRGAGCPLCFNKSEAIVFEKLKIEYPTLVTQFKKDWCKNINHLPFDFCIPELNIIIEVDGSQHFRQISNWRSPEDQYNIDKYKERCANDNNYSIIRILQEDVFYNNYNWFEELYKAIKDIQNSNKILNIYICKNNEYINYL